MCVSSRGITQRDLILFSWLVKGQFLTCVGLCVKRHILNNITHIASVCKEGVIGEQR